MLDSRRTESRRALPNLYQRMETSENRIATDYWSSSTVASDPSEAWAVEFDDGDVDKDAKGDSNFVRAVRAGQ